MVIVVLIIIILLIILLFLVVIDIERSISYNVPPCGIFILIISIVVNILFVSNIYIKPIKVYRGNTTLEITYKDNVPIDSIVVLKNR